LSTLPKTPRQRSHQSFNRPSFAIKEKQWTKAQRVASGPHFVKFSDTNTTRPSKT
jgi:hypothetical protein